MPDLSMLQWAIYIAIGWLLTLFFVSLTFLCIDEHKRNAARRARARHIQKRAAVQEWNRIVHRWYSERHFHRGGNR
jgi:hypothetical protein